MCSQTSQIAYNACGNDVKDNYLIAQAKCLNLTDANEKATCLADANSTRQDDKSHCRDVRDARLELCGALTMGGGPYDPPIDPNNFVPADQIVGNTYFPLKKGTKWVYNKHGGRDHYRHGHRSYDENPERPGCRRDRRGRGRR